MDPIRIADLVTGAVLFLFGMSLLGDALQRLSGSRWKPALLRLTRTPLRGILLGAGVTAVVQSSSAVSAMAVGFVNAGMLSLSQASGVILGAILGTSVTGWVVFLSFLEGPNLLSPAVLTAMTAAAGAVLHFSREPARRRAGDLLLGFVVLLSGLRGMSGAADSLGEQIWFRSLLTSLTHPLLGILAGAALAAVLQSASAAVGLLQALSVTGSMTLASALPLLMGITAGASVPVLLSALGSGPEGKRAACLYPAASLTGVIFCASLGSLGRALGSGPVPDTVMDPFSLAAANTLLRLVMVLVLAPCLDALVSLVTWLVPLSDGAAVPRASAI